MPKPKSLEELLARAFTRVAQHACRQGEKGSRAWPPLSELPAPESWEMVGQQYAREFAVELLEHYFSRGKFLRDLAKVVSKSRR